VPPLRVIPGHKPPEYLSYFLYCGEILRRYLFFAGEAPVVKFVFVQPGRGVRSRVTVILPIVFLKSVGLMTIFIFGLL
jgi:hypothetical protein